MHLRHMTCSTPQFIRPPLPISESHICSKKNRYNKLTLHWSTSGETVYCLAGLRKKKHKSIFAMFYMCLCSDSEYTRGITHCTWLGDILTSKGAWLEDMLTKQECLTWGHFDMQGYLIELYTYIIMQQHPHKILLHKRCFRLLNTVAYLQSSLNMTKPCLAVYHWHSILLQHCFIANTTASISQKCLQLVRIHLRCA